MRARRVKRQRKWRRTGRGTLVRPQGAAVDEILLLTRAFVFAAEKHASGAGRRTPSPMCIWPGCLLLAMAVHGRTPT
jgi:hypothetical protein